MSRLRWVGGWLLSACAMAVEPTLEVTWDQAAVRAAAAGTAPSSAWFDEAASARLRTFARDSALADATLPDLGAAWDQWGLVSGQGAVHGAQRWSITGLGAPTWLTLRSGQTPVVQNEIATIGSAPESVLAASAGAPIAVSVRGSALRRLEPSAVAVLDRMLIGWRDESARMVMTVQAQDGRWNGAATLPLTTLLPLDPGFCAAIPDAPVRCAVHMPPPLMAALTMALAGPDEGFVRDVLGGELDAVARNFSGDLAVTITPGLPRPHILVVMGLVAGAELVPIVGNLGDAFRGRQTVVAGAAQAWAWDTPAGTMSAAISGQRLVVGSDPAVVAAALAGQGAAWPLAGGAVADVRVDPEAFAALLPLAAWVLPHPALANDALTEQLRELAVAVEPLLAAGANDWTPVLHQTLPGIAFQPGLPERLTAVFGGADASHLASGITVFTAAGQTPVLVGRRASGWFAVQGADAGGRFTAARLKGLLSAYQRRLGPELEALTVLTMTDPPRLDLTHVPLAALAALPGPWTATITQDGNGATLVESGLPIASLYLGWQAIRLWQSASARPAATVDM